MTGRLLFSHDDDDDDDVEGEFVVSAVRLFLPSVCRSEIMNYNLLGQNNGNRLRVDLCMFLFFSDVLNLLKNCQTSL